MEGVRRTERVRQSEAGGEEKTDRVGEIGRG